jgi:hypothetical protein
MSKSLQTLAADAHLAYYIINNNIIIIINSITGQNSGYCGKGEP